MRPVQTAWLSREVLFFLVEEANRMAPAETGGVLLGYWTQQTSEPVITHTIGAGPDAIHEPRRFVPDHEYQLTEIARLYRESDRCLDYLGDWHTHPGVAPYLSKSDRATLKRIATEKAARAPRPVMLILAPGPKWEPSAWIGGLEGTTFWSRRLVTHPLEIHFFRDTIDPPHE
jgi:integrative and conjugative element protein (TIGR02256 family)